MRLPTLSHRNWPLKLAAFGLALLLWAVVRVDAPTRQVLPAIPVRVLMSDPDWALAGDAVPSAVEVRLSGSTRELIRLAVNRPTIVVPVDEVTNQDTAVVLRREWIRLEGFPTVAVEDFQPSSVRLAFERVASRSVPLRLTLSGTLPDGLALAAQPSPEPGRTRVSGPESRVNEIEWLDLRPIDLSEVSGPEALKVPVLVEGAAGLDVTPDTAVVAIRVEDTVERIVTGISVEAAMPPGLAPVEVLPDTVAVTLRGARSLVEGFDPDELTVVAPSPAPPGDADVTEWKVELRIRGVPDLMGATLEVDSVTIRTVRAS